MLQERTLGPKSFFRHYISNLPIGVPGIPLFYSQEAIQALEEYPPLRCSDCLCLVSQWHTLACLSTALLAK